jgi:hypothetical protein
MAYVQTSSQLKIPFGGRCPRSRRTSLQGAQVAVVRSGSQASRMLVQYYLAGPLTDLQMGERVKLKESRVSARRNGLIDRGLVEYVDDVMGPFGAENGRYGLTGYGREVAGELARAIA